jgi:glycosyltransferase involved in cell wall biosynthesis
MHVLAMLHLYTPHHNAGAEMATHALLRTLVDSGHDVDVLLSRKHPEFTEPYTYDGVRVHPYRDKADPLRWLTDENRRPHLLVTHLENTDRASILGDMYRVPVAHIQHNTFTATRLATAMGRPALVVANTEWMAADLRDWWSLHQGAKQMPPVIVVHPPVPAADYATTPGDHITLINLSDGKGAYMFYALAKRFPDRKFLGVAGAYGEQVLLELPNVELLPHVRGDRMREEVYARTKVLLVPSWYESYGRVAVEAAHSGIPVIAHPTPGLREALGEAGVFADRDDADAWEAELKRLLSPRGWSAASKRIAAHAATLDPTSELERWVRAVEVIGGGPRPARHG